jgi:hypothetical protein
MMNLRTPLLQGLNQPCSGTMKEIRDAMEGENVGLRSEIATVSC